MLWWRKPSRANSFCRGYRSRCLVIFFHFFSKFSEIKCENWETCLKVDCRFFVDRKREKYVFLDYFAICDKLWLLRPNIEKSLIFMKSGTNSDTLLMPVLWSFIFKFSAISRPDHSKTKWAIRFCDFYSYLYWNKQSKWLNSRKLKKWALSTISFNIR